MTAAITLSEAEHRNLAGILEVFNGERFYSTGTDGNTKTGADFKECYVV